MKYLDIRVSTIYRTLLSFTFQFLFAVISRILCVTAHKSTHRYARVSVFLIESRRKRCDVILIHYFLDRAFMRELLFAVGIFYSLVREQGSLNLAEMTVTFIIRTTFHVAVLLSN